MDITNTNKPFPKLFSLCVRCEGMNKIWKREGKQYRDGFHKIGRVRNPLPTMCCQSPSTLTHDLILTYPVNNYLLKVNNRNTRKRYEICSKLTIKIREQRQWHRSGVFNVIFKHISHLFLVFPLLTLNS